MGVLFGYYAAADDQDAGRAVVRTDGEPSGTGYDQFVVKGVDPIVDLLTVEFVLTGRPASVIKADPRHGHLVATVGEGDVVSVSLTDAFRDELASVDREFLNDVARSWASSGRFSTPPDEDHLADFLQQLAALAERAVGQGHGLYCWICP
ncbi:hypothetical protein [Streptomyces resistomycificus]|uniref:DUF1877 domain-containing protein n=1 Tax=Streptomyces resistomycificus TaxID=67356 RepID=A0A0L8L4I6_9ACTN|nr:hypothetical protein [Streptomyces resistomycificus]KOG33057.1 hypothetical protein ADK37_24565 [Streptomyces resistomycificus]KUN94397.1 hypothetical protein AQJ84_27355 [Streptomyces resistomycificus]